MVASLYLILHREKQVCSVVFQKLKIFFVLLHCSSVRGVRLQSYFSFTCNEYILLYELISNYLIYLIVSRLFDVFPQGMGFVLVFEFMVSDLSEMIRDATNPLTTPQE